MGGSLVAPPPDTTVCVRVLLLVYVLLSTEVHLIVKLRKQVRLEVLSCSIRVFTL